MNLNNLIFDMASLSGTVEDAVDRLIMLYANGVNVPAMT